MRTWSPILLLPLVLALAGCPRDTSPVAANDPSAAEAPAMHDPDPAAPAPDDAPKGKRAPGQENEPLMAWRAFGTEPFWQARVDGGDLYFSTPEDQDGRLMHGRRVPSLVGFVYIGKDGDTDFHLDISPGECSDGMSDNRYEFRATFIYGETTYKGCGEAAK